MEILGVVFLHHVLVNGQPRCVDTQFSGPPEAQLLWEMFKKKKKEINTVI